MKQSNKPSKLIQLFEEHILPWEKKIKKFDPREVQTLKHNIEEDLQSKMDSIKDESQVIDFLKSVFEEILALDLDKFERRQTKAIKKAKKRLIKEDERVGLFFQLIKEADKITPLISFRVLNRMPFLFLNENIAKSNGVGLDCKELKGERRAERMADYYVDVSERLYTNYVKILWEFCQILRGDDEIKSLGSFGSIIENLRRHLPVKYHPLIDFEAAWYRNAFAHRDRIYLPKNGELLLRHSKGKEAKQVSICMNCLQHKTEEKLLIAGIYLKEIQYLYLMKNVYIKGGLMRLSVDFFKNSDIFNISEEEATMLDAKINQLFSGVARYQFTRN